MSTRIDYDGEIITAVAEGPVSGGAWVKAGSYTSTVTADSKAQYAATKIKVQNGASGMTYPVGLSLFAVASGTNNLVSCLTQGLIIAPVNGALDPAASAGRVSAVDNGAGQVGVLTAGANGADIIGTALTPAASGGFAIVHFRL